MKMQESEAKDGDKDYMWTASGGRPLRHFHGDGGGGPWLAHHEIQLLSEPRVLKLTPNTLPGCGIEENGWTDKYHSEEILRPKWAHTGYHPEDLWNWWAPGPGNRG